MRTIRDIYATYQIPPWLQMHQIRVAAVGRFVAALHDDSCDTDLIVTTCLVHDIGAIVKFDLREAYAPLYGYDPATLPKWRDVQLDIRERYGTSEHEATHAILEELHMPRVIDIFEKIGFAKLEQTTREGPREAQIVQYADMRVAPGGVVPLDERFDDARERYGPGPLSAAWYPKLETYRAHAHTLERALFEGRSESPGDLTDAVIAPHMETLWDYHIA